MSVIPQITPSDIWIYAGGLLKNIRPISSALLTTVTIRLNLLNITCCFIVIGLVFDVKTGWTLENFKVKGMEYGKNMVKDLSLKMLII